MIQPIHPLHREYNQIRLGCGFPSHRCDAMTFLKLKELNCPSCKIPFTTDKSTNESLRDLQALLQDFVLEHLQIFFLQKELISAGDPLPENWIEEQNIKEVTLINRVIALVNRYPDRFPFKRVSDA